MRIGPCTLLLALSFAPVLQPQSTFAQTAKPPARKAATSAATAPTAKPAATPTPAAPAACNCPTPVVTPQHVQPYSAKQKSTRVQSLADGTIITTVTESQIWRDAEGRMRQELFSTLSDGTQSRSIGVTDPVARVRMGWSVGNPSFPQVVNLNHMPQPFSQPVQPAPINPQPVRPRFYPNTSESLPPQTIEGLYATGSRNTRTTPTGYEGNDRDMVTTTESWFAPSLGIQLRTVSDDPRNGKSTTEVTDFQQTDPDPSLFKAPEGYEVKDTTPTPAPTATPAACNCSAPVVQQHFRPYVAMQRITNVNTRADGTTVTTFTPAQEWRDDFGRERNEYLRTLPDGTQYRDESIYDLVARVRMVWSVGKPNTPNIVTVYPLDTPGAQPAPQAPAAQPASPAPANPQTDRRYFQQRTESLPPQTIAGLYVQGIRKMTTTPAGYQGSDHDITNTQEIWTSPDMGIQLRVVIDDPRSRYGRTITEVTDIQFVAPDPAVFKAPEGYEVKEANQ